MRGSSKDAGFGPGEEGLPDMHKKVEFVEPIEISETGYVYIWVSNESQNTEVIKARLKVYQFKAFIEIVGAAR